MFPIVGRRLRILSEVASQPISRFSNRSSSPPVAMVAASTDKVRIRNIHEYIQKLPQTTQDRLYTHPATCLALFRSLSETAQQYVMRLLFLSAPVPLETLTSWVVSVRDKENLAATKQLKSARLWSVVKLDGGGDGVSLHVNFRKGLTTAMTGGGMSWYGTQEVEPDKKPKSVEFLDQYAKERWECLLQYMVQGDSESDKISPDIANLLLQSGLIHRSGNEHAITSAGFQFLLLDSPTQIWYFMLKYLDKCDSIDLNLTTCLAFIFQLSFSTLGKVYPIGSHTTFVQHLRQIGLVYQRKHTSPWFYPTRNAIDFLSAGSNKASEKKEGYLVVETNFRIYAYTSNELDIALVALFAEPLHRFENFLVSHITRESVQMALQNGISAKQILDYMISHAHPEMLRSKPTIPPTVTDQLYLWEMERSRLATEEGVLYSQFLSDSDFGVVHEYAQNLGCVQWSNIPKRLLVVNKRGHGDVKKYWKQYKKEHGE